MAIGEKPARRSSGSRAGQTFGGDYIIGIEHIAACRDQLAPLHEEHYAETEGYIGEPLVADYDRYAMLEQRGGFVLFTARMVPDMPIVGNLMYFIGPSMHGQYQVAKEDAFFITRDHRKGFLALRLLKYAEECLRGLGVRYMGMSTKAPSGGPDLDPLLRRAGFSPIAIYYGKRL